MSTQTSKLAIFTLRWRTRRGSLKPVASRYWLGEISAGNFLVEAPFNMRFARDLCLNQLASITRSSLLSEALSAKSCSRIATLATG